MKKSADDRFATGGSYLVRGDESRLNALADGSLTGDTAAVDFTIVRDVPPADGFRTYCSFYLKQPRTYDQQCVRRQFVQ